MAADLSAKVIALVERELRKDPGIQSKELRAKAVRIDESVGSLSGRQFHAQYALQARKRLFGGAGKPASRGKAGQRRKADPVHQLVTQTYEEKRARLESALDQAFRRAIDTDSIGRMNRLLSAIDRHVRELEKA